MITDKQYDILAQKAHFLGGLAAVWGATVMMHNPLAGMAGVLVFATIKEFWYDKKYETPEIRGSGKRDLLYYFAGVMVGMISVFIVH